VQQARDSAVMNASIQKTAARQLRQANFRCAAVLRATPQLLCDVSVTLNQWGTGPRSQEAVLALAEVLTNVVQHGYQQKSDGWIRVHCRSSRHWLDFHVLDGGCDWRNTEPFCLSMPPVGGPVADLPEGGFGWPLINELTDRVSLRRRLNVNRLVLGFDVS
jgi:serine/threonine-protein kinase RsbW